MKTATRPFAPRGWEQRPATLPMGVLGVNRASTSAPWAAVAPSDAIHEPPSSVAIVDRARGTSVGAGSPIAEEQSDHLDERQQRERRNPPWAHEAKLDSMAPGWNIDAKDVGRETANRHLDAVEKRDPARVVADAQSKRGGGNVSIVDLGARARGRGPLVQHPGVWRDGGLARKAEVRRRDLEVSASRRPLRTQPLQHSCLTRSSIRLTDEARHPYGGKKRRARDFAQDVASRGRDEPSGGRPEEPVRTRDDVSNSEKGRHIRSDCQCAQAGEVGTGLKGGAAVGADTRVTEIRSRQVHPPMTAGAQGASGEHAARRPRGQGAHHALEVVTMEEGAMRDRADPFGGVLARGGDQIHGRAA